MEKVVCNIYGVAHTNNVNDVTFYLFASTFKSKKFIDNFEQNIKISIHQTYHLVKPNYDSISYERITLLNFGEMFT